MHLAEGREALGRGDDAAALQAFQGALEKVPYCVPALVNSCVLTGRKHGAGSRRALSCQESLMAVRKGYFDYFGSAVE